MAQAFGVSARLRRSDGTTVAEVESAGTSRNHAIDLRRDAGRVILEWGADRAGQSSDPADSDPRGEQVPDERISVGELDGQRAAGVSARVSHHAREAEGPEVKRAAGPDLDVGLDGGVTSVDERRSIEEATDATSAAELHQGFPPQVRAFADMRDDRRPRGRAERLRPAGVVDVGVRQHDAADVAKGLADAIERSRESIERIGKTGVDGEDPGVGAHQVGVDDAKREDWDAFDDGVLHDSTSTKARPSRSARHRRFRRHGWSTVELTTIARPPDAVVTRQERAAGAELLWLAEQPIAVRSVPTGARGLRKLLFVGAGQAHLRCDDRMHVLGPETFAWLDSDRPFELVATPGQRLLVQWPADLIEQRHPELDGAVGIPRGRGSVGERAIAGLLQPLCSGASELSSTAATAAAFALLEALGMCARRSAIDVAANRVARALAEIERRLGDVALAHDDIARAQGVSRRYLDGLFRDRLGRSLAEHVRVRRLARAAEDLVALPHERAADIARRWGFSTASHFTRLFRRAYGELPSAVRARGGPLPK